MGYKMKYDALQSLISNFHMVTDNTWTVSICRDTKVGQNPLHVFLIIEGLEDGEPFLHHAHLVKKGKRDTTTGKFIAESKTLSAMQGYAQVLFKENLPRQYFLDAAKTYLYKTFAVPKTSAQALIKKIKADVQRTEQENAIPYNITGQAKFTAISYGSRETHSCVSYMQSLLVNWRDEQGTYVLDKDQRESIHPKNFQAFLQNLIATDPRDILPEEQETIEEINQRGSGNCLLM